MRNDPNVGKKYGQKKGEPSRNPCGLGIYGKETLKLKEFTAKEHVEVLAKLLRLTPKER